MKKRYSVTKMACAACAAGIERTVRKLAGVERCSVSLMGECMDVEFDETAVSEETILGAVKGLGYGIYEYGKTPKDRGRIPLLLRFLVSLVLLLPEMYLSMGHMAGLPVPEGWLNHGLQIGLTLAVLAVN